MAPRRFDESSVLCGVCETELTVPAYLAAVYRCPSCYVAFKPGCANHDDLYAGPTERAE